MSKFVMDAYAWIEYMIGSGSGRKVRGIVENLRNDVFTNMITLGEIASVVARRGRDPKQALRTITALSKIYSVDANFCFDAGLLHAKIRKKIKDFGYADAFILLTARNLGAKILTGDTHFRNFDEAVMI